MPRLKAFRMKKRGTNLADNVPIGDALLTQLVQPYWLTLNQFFHILGNLSTIRACRAESDEEQARRFGRHSKVAKRVGDLSGSQGARQFLLKLWPQAKLPRWTYVVRRIKYEEDL